MFSDELIDQLSQLIIRPHRQVYGLDKLGPKKLIIRSPSLCSYIQIYRQECTILSSGKKIQLSIFQSNQKPSSSTQISTNEINLSKSIPSLQSNAFSQNKAQITVFLHTNSGSRLQGLQYCKYLLQHGEVVCLFDYSGSGVSQGQYVTMGLNQSIDLANVIQYLKSKFNVDKVNLWGRSMGAVTAVLYSAKYPRNVRKMVLDSPFCDFRQLVKQIVSTRTGLPEFLFGSILSRIEEHLKKKLRVNMMDIDLKNQIVKPGMQKIPIFLLISKDDKLVRPAHVQILYQLHKGYKKILYLEGSHNKPRPTQIREQCADFLCNKILNVSSQKNIQGVKKQYINILSRKYSEDTSASDPRSKISSSSFILSNSQSKLTPNQEQNQHLYSSTNSNTSSNKNTNIYPNTNINLELNGNSTSKYLPTEPFFINLMKKNRPQTQLVSNLSTPRQDHSLNKYNGSKISLSQLKKSQAVNGNGDQTPAAKYIPIGYNKNHLQFKKQSKTTMAIQYKNKIKQHINRM